MTNLVSCSLFLDLATNKQYIVYCQYRLNFTTQQYFKWIKLIFERRQRPGFTSSLPSFVMKEFLSF